MFHGEDREAFIQTLAIGGVDGTLDDRFTGTSKGRVFAKSGSVAGVRTLSGYLQTEAGDWFAFSILVNDVRRRHRRQGTAIARTNRGGCWMQMSDNSDD